MRFAEMASEREREVMCRLLVVKTGVKILQFEIKINATHFVCIRGRRHGELPTAYLSAYLSSRRARRRCACILRGTPAIACAGAAAS